MWLSVKWKLLQMIASMWLALEMHEHEIFQYNANGITRRNCTRVDQDVLLTTAGMSLI